MLADEASSHDDDAATRRSEPPTSGAHDPEPIDLAAGTRIAGGYTITSSLGRGAVGRVYAAVDEILHRRVAIKLLHPHVARDSEASRRFTDEARVMARVDHPNVVRVHAHGVWCGHPYLVMDLVAGGTLAGFLASLQSTVPIGWALRVIGSVCAGVDAVHRAGAVHNDVKPANVLMGCDGRMALGDFGLGRPAGAVDVRSASDVYALGVLAFEVLTGRLPFVADDARALVPTHATPPAASAIRNELGAEVDRVLARALDEDPARRQRSAGMLASQLHAALA